MNPEKGTLHTSPLNAKVKYYLELGTKFTAYTSAERNLFLYVEPSYKLQGLEYSNSDPVQVLLNYRGVGGKVGVGALITKHIMVDLNAGQHWLHWQHLLPFDKNISGSITERQKVRNYALNVSYAF
tara:strand:- start:2843 stop:3220 length:378 start_codon:yes stop_codon:yes gene_type:complete